MKKGQQLQDGKSDLLQNCTVYRSWHVEPFWGVLPCCLTLSILFNFRYKKNKNLWLIYLHILTGPRGCSQKWKCAENIFKRGYEEIRDRKLLDILKKDRKWLKYELHCNVKTPAPLFFQNNLTFVIEMLINVNKCLPANRFCSNIFFAH